MDSGAGNGYWRKQKKQGGTATGSPLVLAFPVPYRQQADCDDEKNGCADEESGRQVSSGPEVDDAAQESERRESDTRQDDLAHGVDDNAEYRVLPAFAAATRRRALSSRKALVSGWVARPEVL